MIVMSKEEFIQKKLTEKVGQSKFGGRVDPKNKLNDLTGKEWTHFLCSVKVTSYSTQGKEGFSHDLRKIHPSPKPPQLMKEIIEFFTKKGQWVLDPFVGVGGTLLGCSLSDRNGVGIDLVQKYLDVYEKVCEREGLKKQIVKQGDARNIEEILNNLRKDNKGIPEKFDLILTDPPYCNMMAKKRTATLKRGKERTPFSNLSSDIGNLDYDEFLEELKNIIEKNVKFLHVKKYLVMFIKDLQPNEHHNMLHADVINKLNEIRNLKFRGYKIWFDKTQTLYPFGYPYAFVANQFHQFILVFRKERE